ncbi:hypothetical protein TNCV_1459561 [Trichonephila clavipes]|nr:hypothetical protein TNCV_1459561 [Trichonephila clavipes]
MTLTDCRRPLFACRMIYRPSPAFVVLGRPPPNFLTAVPVVWNAFQASETTLLLIPNSAATLVTIKITSKEHLGWGITGGLMNGTPVGKQGKWKLYCPSPVDYWIPGERGRSG